MLDFFATFNAGDAVPTSSYRVAAPFAPIILLNLFAIVFYAITAPPITTVAHILAILMGVILQVAARKYGREDSSSFSSAESSATPLLTAADR